MRRSFVGGRRCKGFDGPPRTRRAASHSRLLLLRSVPTARCFQRGLERHDEGNEGGLLSLRCGVELFAVPASHALQRLQAMIEAVEQGGRVEAVEGEFDVDLIFQFDLRIRPGLSEAARLGFRGPPRPPP
jgi:hypothetical protein